MIVIDDDGSLNACIIALIDEQFELFYFIANDPFNAFDVYERKQSKAIQIYDKSVIEAIKTGGWTIFTCLEVFTS